jgi:hypothetical protein
MDYIPIIIDSVETSVMLKIFKNKQESILAHIFKSKLVKIPLSKFSKDIDNFNPDRLQNSPIKAYPLNDRPRGNDDISSVKYYQKQIHKEKDITPIWMIQKNKKYILLDGVHRIVASFIEEKKYINAYVIIM